MEKGADILIIHKLVLSHRKPIKKKRLSVKVSLYRICSKIIYPFLDYRLHSQRIQSIVIHRTYF